MKGGDWLTVEECVIDSGKRHGYCNRKMLTNEYGCSEYKIHESGGVKYLCKKNGIEYKCAHRNDRNDILEDIKRVYDKNRKISLTIYLENGKYSKTSITTEFGSFNNALRILGIETYERNFSKEEAKRDILSVYRLNPEKFSSTIYRDKGKYSQSVIERLYGSWCNAMEEIGIKPACKKVGKEHMLQCVLKLNKEFGFISKKLVNENCDFTYQAVISSIGSRKMLKEKYGIKTLSVWESSGAKTLYKLLCEIYGKDNVEKEKTFDFLINKKTNRHLYFDFFISPNICVEYDGEQHFKYVEFIQKNEENFEKQKYRDEEKDMIANNHGLKVVRFRFDEPLDIEHIRNKLVV